MVKGSKKILCQNFMKIKRAKLILVKVLGTKLGQEYFIFPIFNFGHGVDSF